MRNSKADRRSQRTRELLSGALVALMLEQRYDEITIQDIIDRANVGRSTFYAHYLDKDDLLVSNFTHVIDTLIQHGDPHQPELRPSLVLFLRHVQTQQQLYKALVRGGGIDLLYKKGQQYLQGTIKAYLAALIPAGQPAAAPLDLIAECMAGTMLTMLKWWLDHEIPCPPEELDALFHRLVLPGIEATLHIPASAA
jgi:AcrR family transcriptional regulator